MNQFFSFERFSLLVKKHWVENKKRYSLSILAYTGLLIPWFLSGIIMHEEDIMDHDVQQLTFFFSLFVVGTFYASQYFSDLGSRAKGSNFILVPASTFEKFLCSLLYTVLLFLIVFTAAFYLADVLMVTLANAFSTTNDPNLKATVLNVFKVKLIQFNPEVAINLVLFFISIQSLFLLGSVYFKKYSFIKTIITGFVIVIVLFSMTFFLMNKFLPNREDDFLLKAERSVPYILLLLAYIIAPISWIITYFLLKQKQV